MQAERVLEYVVELSDEIVKTAQPYGLDEVISKAGESKAEAMDKLAEVRALIEEYEAGLSDTEAPTTAAPETEAPTTTVPETQPTTTVPETEAPTTTVPETQPTTTVPEQKLRQQPYRRHSRLRLYRRHSQQQLYQKLSQQQQHQKHSRLQQHQKQSRRQNLLLQYLM